MRTTVIVTALGPDGHGLLAKVATTVADCNANIDDVSQTVSNGMFTMIMFVSFDETETTMADLKAALEKTGERDRAADPRAAREHLQVHAPHLRPAARPLRARRPIPPGRRRGLHHRAGDPRDRQHDPVRESGRARRHHGHLARRLLGARPAPHRRAHPRQDRAARRAARGRGRPARGEVRHPHRQQARLAHAHRRRGGQRRPRRVRRGGARPGRRRRGDRHRLRRRLQRHGAEGPHTRRRSAHRGHPGGHQRHQPRVLVGQRGLHARRHQHGRRGAHGRRDQGALEADRGRRLHRLRQARRVLQRARGQPVHGRRPARQRRAGGERQRRPSPAPAWCATSLPTTPRPRSSSSPTSSSAPPSRSRASASSSAREASQMLDAQIGIIDLSLAPTPAVGDSIAEILESMGLEQVGAPGTTAALAMLNDAVKKGGTMATSSTRRPVRRLHPGERGRGHGQGRGRRRAQRGEARGHDRGVLARSGHDRRARATSRGTPWPA